MNIADTVRRMTCPTCVCRTVSSTRFILVAYTLVLVVVVFVVRPSWRRERPSPELRSAKTTMAHYVTALNAFKAKVGRYPTTAEGLDAPVVIGRSQDPWGEDRFILPWPRRDPWGNEYQYANPATHNVDSYDLSSFGPDGKPDTDDDITDWPTRP
jgi:general secretion pathway protein G